MNNNILELIYTVYKNYKHVNQLDTLLSLLQKSSEDYTDEIVVLKTTINSLYNYGLYGLIRYQNSENHIDTFIEDYNYTIACKVNKYIIKHKRDNEIYWKKDNDDKPFDFNS